MIVTERRPRTALRYQIDRNNAMENNFKELEWDMLDGRLTEPSDGKKYKLREAIAEVKKLGRQLTNEELKRFEV